MKKIFLALALASASCTTPIPLNSPAPLAHTTIDERGFIIALQTFDTTLTAVDRLVAAGVIKPGTPIAVRLADTIREAKLAFQTAGAALNAGNTTSYFTALTQAQAAIATINVLVKGN